MKTHLENIKILWPIKKKMFFEYIVMTVFMLLFTIGMSKAVEFYWFSILSVVPLLMMAYEYWTYYKPLIEDSRKEVELKLKYPFMYDTMTKKSKY